MKNSTSFTNCFFNIDDGPNTTVTCLALITGVSIANGDHNVTVFVNDSVGLVGSDRQPFTFVNTVPSFLKIFPDIFKFPFIKLDESNDFR